MSVLKVYCSAPNQGIDGFFLALGRQVQLMPLELLPNPDPQRRQALELLRAELREEITNAQHDLDRLLYGDVPADAGRENGLKADLDALTSRLRGLDTVLGTQKGGADNA
ncbi:hypothetical protein [Hymenobacter rubidus]|uniref:hypothetical protein n=1 Tax=Hymenobacter rubidus TaxID=1441626 RepID=UPI00191DE2B1|nr:hypothetical protein [Hymenobacter rubidus]